MIELTQKDEKVAELLTEAGLKKNTAKIIVYLHKADEAESRQIERAANLRQPEVSIAMKELKAWDWVKEREIKTRGKGRPLKSYKLATNLKEIVHSIITKKKEKLKDTEEDLKELEKALS